MATEQAVAVGVENLVALDFDERIGGKPLHLHHFVKKGTEEIKRRSGAALNFLRPLYTPLHFRGVA